MWYGPLMKIWHDDIRLPPDDSWSWARTNSIALTLLRENEVDEISLDHDLGLEYEDPHAREAYLRRGRSLTTGLDLVRVMCEEDLIPPKVTIHSWNPTGARYMAEDLAKHGCRAIVRPYEP
jgi:hypothetical protein